MQINFKFYKTDQETEKEEKLIIEKEKQKGCVHRLRQTAFVLFDFR